MILRHIYKYMLLATVTFGRSVIFPGTKKQLMPKVKTGSVFLESCSTASNSTEVKGSTRGCDIFYSMSTVAIPCEAKNYIKNCTKFTNTRSRIPPIYSYNYQ